MGNQEILLSYLRENARIPLSEISNIEGIAKSTLHSNLSKVGKKILKHTVILNHHNLGLAVRAFFFAKLKVDNHRFDQPFVNTISKLNNGSTFFDCVFENFDSYSEFNSYLEDISDEMTSHFVVESYFEENFKIKN